MKTYIVKVNDFDKFDIIQNCKVEAKQYLRGPDFQSINKADVMQKLETGNVDEVVKILKPHFDYMTKEIGEENIHLSAKTAFELIKRGLGLLHKFDENADTTAKIFEELQK